MNVLWLVAASLVWTGLIAAAAEWIAGASVRPHFAQGVWRGAAALMLLPWLAAGVAFMWPAVADSPLPAFDGASGAAGAAISAIGGVESAIDASTAPMIGWVVFALLLAGWGVRLVSMVLSQRKLQVLKQSAEPAAGRGDAARWSAKLGLADTPDVRAIPSGSPFVAGVGQRTIFVPACVRDDETRSLIIAHECVHLSRRDLLTRPFERLVADIVWFSPFAWLARRRLDYFREAVCDAETIELTGERTGYARALTNVARAVRPVPMLPVSGFVPKRKAALTRRVKGIVDESEPRPNRMAAALAGALALVAAPLAIAQGIALEKQATQTVFTHPVVAHEKSKISSGFGWREWEGEDKIHKGVDIAAPKGVAVYAPADGKISYVGSYKDDAGYGNNLAMYLEDGRKMRFASLDKVKVEVGQLVKAGDIIGTVGKSAKDSTGPHVHVELWQLSWDSDKHEAVDPREAGVEMCPNDDKAEPGWSAG